MQTFVILNCDGKPLASFHTERTAKDKARELWGNMIIETDDQNSPRPILNTWVLVAHANSSPYWMNTANEFAALSIAQSVLYRAPRA